MTVTALKTAIENELVSLISAFATASGASLDADLSTNQKLIEVTGGYLLSEQDYQKGPLVRLKVEQYEPPTDETGAGSQGRGFLFDASVKVCGVSKFGTSYSAQNADRNTIEEVVRLDLLKANLENIKTILTGGKAGYAALLDIKSVFFYEQPTVSSAPATNALVWAMAFEQIYRLRVEEHTGP